MPVIVDTKALDYTPMSSILIKTLLASLSVLSAFQIRDCVIQGIQLFTPSDATKRWLFTLLITMFFLFCTCLIAYAFQDKVDG